jgi:MHS family alpha-ketoglutarate permease-like MFS transporter
MLAANPAIARPAQGSVWPNVVRACLGNLVEWFDWFIYAWFAIYFAATFFPAHDATAQLLSTAVVFAIGFLMRPLGGWVLGLYADRRGRRAALTLSVSLMSAGSLAIAFNPGYEAIGIAAPVLLVVARIAQGLSLGGEFGTSASYLTEVADPRRRSFFASFQFVSIVLGQLLALLTMIVLQRLLSESAMGEWGWRVPFVLGAVIGLTVFYLRRRMQESDAFLEHQREMAQEMLEVKAGRRARTRVGMTAIIREYPRGFAIAFGVAIGGGVVFYTYTGFLERYLVSARGFDKDDVSLMSFGALAVFLVLQPAAGWLADRIGARRVMGIFALGTMTTTPLVFVVMAHTSSLLVAFLGLVVGLSFLACYGGAAATLYADQFPTKVRALGMGMSHSLANAIFGGTTEMLALSLKESGHEGLFPWYIVATAGATLLALAFVAPAVAPAPASVSRVVARVDVNRVDAQQLGHLLDQDGQHQRLEVGTRLTAVLDRPTEQHEPRRLATAAADQ